MLSLTGIELIYASEGYKEVIKNLMQFYIYDFSEYVNYDVEESGLFSVYPDLVDYWKEAGDKFPYVIKKDHKYVGFVLVKAIKSEKEQFSIAEFFVMKKYRRQGIGKAVAMQLFGSYKGLWKVHQRENNQSAQQFWIKVISNYTNGCSLTVSKMENVYNILEVNSCSSTGYRTWERVKDSFFSTASRE